MTAQVNTRAYAPGDRKAGRTPVSAHPAFPVIVALWFAALLGLGSLVLPVALFERTAEATGLAAMFPAAQAPLGMTARILIALVAAALGAAAGIEIARKVAASDRSRQPARAAPQPFVASAEDQGAIRPISAHEELGYDNLDAGTGEDEVFTAAAPAFLRGPDASDADELVDGGDAAPIAPPALDLGAFEHEFEPAETAFTHCWSALPPAAPCIAEAPLEESSNDSAATEEPAVVVPPHAEPPLAPAGSFPLTSGEPAIADLVERFARALETRRAAAPSARAVDAPEQAHAAARFAHAPESADETHDEAEDGAGYSSILAMRGSFGKPRSLAQLEDDQPNPATGGALGAGAGDTERALRDALEKLQRLSGAA